MKRIQQGVVIYRHVVLSDEVIHQSVSDRVQRSEPFRMRQQLVGFIRRRTLPPTSVGNYAP